MLGILASDVLSTMRGAQFQHGKQYVCRLLLLLADLVSLWAISPPLGVFSSTCGALGNPLAENPRKVLSVQEPATLILALSSDLLGNSSLPEFLDL